MVYVRYTVLVMLFSLAFLAGCGSSLHKAMQDPAAMSGTSSEELWYQYGGARVAYTAVTRPKQLNTGYNAVRDPALYGQMTTTTEVKAPAKKRVKAKAAAPAPRDPNCPPCPPCPACPPTDATGNKLQSVNPQTSPTFFTPGQGSTDSNPLPPALLPGGANAAATPPPAPPTPLPSMPAAIPAPLAPEAPGT